ncbi:MAG TPA: 16S rRNA (cytosine(967)-C(5))-methyltransferase RsmB [Nitrospira sp.]|nr:16S rRNA (cytosine(967)-C(5))-methyltransferase RsmB [Nitrospira sp.]
MSLPLRMPSGPSSDTSPTSPSRTIALAVLVESLRTEEGLDVLMDRALARPMLDGRDRGLAVEITYGVMRRLGTIDWRLGPVLDKPLDRLPVAVQMLLRMGAYQLLFLDRIPASAAVSESVKLAKGQRQKLKRDWSGLVNAVLRALIREPSPSWPPVETDSAKALAVKFSVPEWLSHRWIERWGVERAAKACDQASGIPPLTLRVNRLQISRDEFLDRLHMAGVAAKPTRVSPVGAILEEAGAIPSIPGFSAGDFYVEDEAAQLIPPLLDVQPGDVVLDACAAPGGKATHLAELMKGTGRIYALDRSETRLKLLEANRTRLRHEHLIPVVGDLRNPSWAQRVSKAGERRGPSLPFDRILVDAPCSGLGVLRRHPEAKWRKRSEQFERHQALQLQLLDSAALCLRPGGVLVYSTCSTEGEENEAVIDEFLRSHADFRRESVLPWLPAAGRYLVTERGDLFTMGNQDSMDGFYAARLKHVCS